MSNMLIYVYQICPHALCWSRPGKLGSVGGDSGRGGPGRKEIPSSSEVSGREVEACSRCYFLRSFRENLPGGHLFSFYRRRRSPWKSEIQVNCVRLSAVSPFTKKQLNCPFLLVPCCLIPNSHLHLPQDAGSPKG